MNGLNDNQPKIGTGEGESPLAPPQPKMDMRTIGSDMKSIQESGGQGARPYIPPPPMPSNKPQEPVFQPPQVETPPPAGGMPPMGMPTMEMEPAKPKAGKGLWITLVVVILLALIAVGYFVVYPALSPTEPVTETTPTVPPAEESIPTPPAEEPPATEEPPIVEEPPLSSADLLPTMTGHISLFTTPADDTVEILLPEATVTALRSAAISPVSADGFHEVVFINSFGQRISPQAILSLLVPAFFDSQTLDYFETDATFFAATDQGTSWLGYVLKLKAETDIGAVQTRMAALQGDSDNNNLFLTDPGEIGIWRDGQISDKPASLVDFSQAGATLGYAWLERNLLITTNLTVGETATDRLGF